MCFTGADPGIQVRGGALTKIAPSEGRRENIWGISCGSAPALLFDSVLLYVLRYLIFNYLTF
jgi:hypothetical protein